MDSGVTSGTMNVFDDPALAILIDLEHQGFDLRVTGGELFIKPAARVTSEIRDRLHQHKTALVMLVDICDDSVQDRVAMFKELIATKPTDVMLPALVFRPGTPYVKGTCFSCGDALPETGWGRCWRCSLGWRLAVGVPIPVEQAAVYDRARVVA